MKKEYIFPVVSVLYIDTVDLLSNSPYTGDDEEEEDWGTTEPGDPIIEGNARCRNDFGSLW